LWGRAEKEVTFLTTFRKQKQVLGPKLGIFSPFETTKLGGVKKAFKGVYIT
jgi:hypothetical protein